MYCSQHIGDSMYLNECCLGLQESRVAATQTELKVRVVKKAEMWSREQENGQEGNSGQEDKRARQQKRARIRARRASTTMGGLQVLQSDQTPSVTSLRKK